MIREIHSRLISTQGKMLEKLQYVAMVTGRSGLCGVIRVSGQTRHTYLLRDFHQEAGLRHIALCEPPDRGLLRTILSSDISGFCRPHQRATDTSASQILTFQ